MEKRMPDERTRIAAEARGTPGDEEEGTANDGIVVVGQ